MGQESGLTNRGKIMRRICSIGRAFLLLGWASRASVYISAWRRIQRKSEISRFAEPSAEKESSDDCHAIEKAKSKKTEEMELA
jgi:hypothetical protein